MAFLILQVHGRQARQGTTALRLRRIRHRHPVRDNGGLEFPVAELHPPALRLTKVLGCVIPGRDIPPVIADDDVTAVNWIRLLDGYPLGHRSAAFMERAFCRLRNVTCSRLALLDLLKIWAIKIDAMQVCVNDSGQGSLAVDRSLDVERADRSRYDPMHTAVTPPGALAAWADLARALRFTIHGQSDRTDRRACQPVSQTCAAPCSSCTMGQTAQWADRWTCPATHPPGQTTRALGRTGWARRSPCTSLSGSCRPSHLTLWQRGRSS